MSNETPSDGPPSTELDRLRERVRELETADAELRDAEAELRQQNTFLNTVLESIPHPFYVIDARDYTILMANSATGAGIKRGEDTCYALTHHNDEPCGKGGHPCPLAEAKKTGGPVVMEHIHYDKDGNARNVEVHGYPILDDQGNVVQMIENCLDVTGRTMAEREKDRVLKQMSCLLRIDEMMRAKEDMSTIFNDVAEVLPRAFADPSTTRVQIVFDGEAFGAEDLEGPGMRLATRIPVRSQKRGQIEVLQSEEESSAKEESVQEKEQDLIDSIARHLGETVERREAQAQVLQSSKLAAIGELAAGVAHEINNPVNGIMNCADILTDALENGSKEHEFAGLIRSESDRIAAIVKNLLNFARHDETESSPASVCDIAVSVLSLCKKKIEMSGVHLEMNVPEDLPRIECRSEQIQQVLMNIIMNALYALDERYPGHDPAKVLSIEARTLQANGQSILRIAVTDSGTGIPQSDRRRIFDPFFTTKGPDQGTGLGLAVSLEIMTKHGGALTVESEEGQYTRFHLDFSLND